MSSPERLTRESWLEIGLNLLGAEGDKSLTIDRLCQMADRSKGSFYHHFKNRDVFVDALLQFWQSTYTQRIIFIVDQLENRNERRRKLDHLAASLDSQVERAIRNWSVSNLQVQQALQSVDQQRIQYLAKLIGELGQLDETVAFELAIVEYATFVGVQHLFPNAEPELIERIIDRLNQMMTCIGQKT